MENFRELDTIQKNHNLNYVASLDAPHDVNKGHHNYGIFRKRHEGVSELISTVRFQNGPRNVEGSSEGVLDVDLLEIVRDRLKSFQEGPYATRENAIALTHIEEALLWTNKRVEDRAAKNTLGTNKI